MAGHQRNTRPLTDRGPARGLYGYHIEAVVNRGRDRRSDSWDRAPDQRRGKPEKNRRFLGAWADLEADILDEIGEPTGTDRILTERFVKNLRAAESATLKADAEPFVPGSAGQLVENPGYLIAARCERVALRLGRELGVLEHPQGRPPKSGARSNLRAVEQGLRFVSGGADDE